MYIHIYIVFLIYIHSYIYGIFVGRINSNTTEHDLRAHLHDIEVNQVANVVKR